MRPPDWLEIVKGRGRTGTGQAGQGSAMNISLNPKEA